MAERILIVEDDPAVLEMTTLALEAAGFRVDCALDTVEAERAMVAAYPDLVLLDWMLPGVSGLEYARRLRRQSETRAIPLIMLTARSEEADTLKGFEAGADDYVPKPFSPRELVARIKAVLRRAGPEDAEGLLEAGALHLDTRTHRVSAGGTPLHLGPTEYRLLKYLMGHAERVHSRSQLLDQVWGRDVYIDERTVDVHIRRLRRVLEAHDLDTFVQTVRGAGYRFSRTL